MLAPSTVATTMDRIGVWWAVAGGWAIDLWLGEQTRDHHDVEVVIRRGDQQVVWQALRGDWNLECLDPPGSRWRPWAGQRVEPPAFQVRATGASGEFDLFLETVVEDSWQHRRDSRVTRPASEVIMVTASGMPVVRPEIQLLYMATSRDPKNARDFSEAAPRLDPVARNWLARHVTLAHPDHPWLPILERLACARSDSEQAESPGQNL